MKIAKASVPHEIGLCHFNTKHSRGGFLYNIQMIGAMFIINNKIDLFICSSHQGLLEKNNVMNHKQNEGCENWEKTWELIKVILKL